MKRGSTAIPQNPYIDLVYSEDDANNDSQPDARIFPAPPGYPTFLNPMDDIRTKNGYIFIKADKERRRNVERCTYERPLPLRGYCVMCGRSGALGEECTNG